MDDDRIDADIPAPPRPPHPDDPLPPPGDTRGQPAAAPPVPPAPPLPPPRTEAPRPYDGAPDPGAKSAALAVFLSLAPGLGHLYLGAYQRAVMIVTVFFLAIYLLPLPLAVFIPLFVWFFGLFDSYRLAQLAELERLPVAARHEQHAKGTLAFGVFLAVVGLVVLADNLWGIDLEWLRDWWPAVLILAGAYFIIEAVRERIGRHRGGPSDDAAPEADEM